MTNENQATATNNPSTKSEGKSSNDFISHYLIGSPIIYVYRITSYIDKNTNQEKWTYKGNMKTGAKSGNNMIPVQGYLSPNALKVVQPMIAMVMSDDPVMKRTLGLSVKAPRFEGVDAFIPKEGEKDSNGFVKPVGVASIRINTIESMMVYEKSSQSDDQKPASSPSEPNQHASAAPAPQGQQQPLKQAV